MRDVGIIDQNLKIVLKLYNGHIRFYIAHIFPGAEGIAGDRVQPADHLIALQHILRADLHLFRDLDEMTFPQSPHMGASQFHQLLELLFLKITALMHAL